MDYLISAGIKVNINPFSLLFIGSLIVYLLSPKRWVAWTGTWFMGIFGLLFWRNTFLDYSMTDSPAIFGSVTRLNIICLAVAIAFTMGTLGYIKELLTEARATDQAQGTQKE